MASGEKFISQYMASEASPSCISWVTYWRKPGRATSTLRSREMKLLLVNFSSGLAKGVAVAIPSLDTQLKKCC